MVIFLKELKEYTETELMAKLLFTVTEYTHFKRTMKEKRVLEQKERNNLTFYSFKFIGILEYKERFIFVVPKYFLEGKTDNERLVQLVRLFQEYAKRENLDYDEIETLGSTDDEEEFNYIAVMDFLLIDYIENGLYVNKRNEYEINGEGEILWHKTIEDQPAYITNGKPFYLDLVTEVQFQDEEDIIRRVHKFVLTQCSAYMEQLSFISDFNYPALEFDPDIEDLGSLDNVLYLIENEIQQQFYDQKLRILKAMYYYLSREKGSEAQEDVNLYGTRTFHVVWEKVCGYVIGNEYDTYKVDIQKPIWHDFGTGKTQKTDTLRPDILKNQPVLETFFIFDAKYYTTTFDSKGNLKNNAPGIEDISKQYMYEKALQTTLFLKNYSWYNLFIIPSEEEENLFGKVELPFLPELQPIHLLRIKAPKVYDMYIRHEIFGLDYFKDLKSELSEKGEKVVETSKPN